MHTKAGPQALPDEQFDAQGKITTCLRRSHEYRFMHVCKLGEDAIR